MDRYISETPDNWVILKLPDNNYKVFATWSGGYLDSDNWKLNSGIKQVEQDDNYYYFIGFSNSCYKCKKTSYGIKTMYGYIVLDTIINKSDGNIVLMEDKEDWVKTLNQ